MSGKQIRNPILIFNFLIFIWGVFASFGPIVAPVIRSLVSKIVTSSEKGKAFSVLAAADNAIPLVSGVCYSALYSATIHSNPPALFYLTMATQIGVFILILYIHMKTDKGEFELETKESINPSDEESDRKETNTER